MLFESDQELAFDDIVKGTGLDEALIKKLLATLTISKFKVLTKSGDNPKVAQRAIQPFGVQHVASVIYPYSGKDGPYFLF